MNFSKGHKYVLLTLLLGISGLIAAMQMNPVLGYIGKAYFYPGTDSAIRGYPIIYPPKNFTGTWKNYSYTGKILSSEEYVNGVNHGKRMYFNDAGKPYYIGYSKNGRWSSTELAVGVPEKGKIPWFFPQRWINRSLDRLAIIDKIFPPKPAVIIEETPKK